MCRGVLNHLHVELVSVISAMSISKAPSPPKSAESKSLHGTEARPISMPITKAPQGKKKIQTLFPVDSTRSNSVHSDLITVSQT